MKTKLTILTTGGTLDGVCHDIGVESAKSLFAEKLENDGRLDLRVISICNKDSRDLGEAERLRMLEEIERDEAGRVLIGHGTYTICETGRYLKARLGDTDKRILLVGSWIPLGVDGSDGETQVEYAVETIMSCGRGVWISMDGRLWDPESTEKQRGKDGSWELAQI